MLRRRREYILPARYCLRCYLPLEPETHACPHCHYPNPTMLWRTFWTREPALVRLEQTLKTLVIVFCGLLLLVVLCGLPDSLTRSWRLGRGAGRAGGWGLFGPFVILGLLWQTVAGVTQRSPYFRASYLWAVILGVVGVFLLVFYPQPRQIWWLIVGLLTAAALSILAGQLFAAWKLNRIARGVERHGLPVPEAPAPPLEAPQEPEASPKTNPKEADGK